MKGKTLELISHLELCEKAESWLREKCNCSTVITELKSKNRTGEIPDSIGFKGTRSKTPRSILIECKTSRADFRADFKKDFRGNPHLGMGDFRFYLCPENIIKAEDLPDKWGLLYYKDGKVRQIVGPKGRTWSKATEFKFSSNKETEMMLILSALRRTQMEDPASYEKIKIRRARKRSTYKRSYKKAA